MDIITDNKTIEFSYKPTPSGIRLHESDKIKKLICGPFGSGKSTACSKDVELNCYAQTKAPNGVRYSRVGVIRSSYPRLQSTTRRSLLEVFPAMDSTADFNNSVNESGSPIKGSFGIPLPDRSFANIEFELQALAMEQDEKRIRSMNWTFAWINEADDLEAALLPFIENRCKRFPGPDLGGRRYEGIIMDCNYPAPGHWLHTVIKAPELYPEYEVIMQPPAAFKVVNAHGEVRYEMNPDAENLDFLSPTYYPDAIRSLETIGRYDIIDSMYCMLDVPRRNGLPVYPGFDYNRHVASRIIEPLPYQPVLAGYDTSGKHPAVAFMQEQRGTWVIIDELYGEGVGMRDFLEGAVVPLVRTKYATNDVLFLCDPANTSDSWTGLTPTQHLDDFGLSYSKNGLTNDPRTRIYAVEDMLNKKVGGLLVSPHCKLCIEAFQGGYRYKKINVSGALDNSFSDKPDKNKHSHIMDAVQYGALYITRSRRIDTSASSAIIHRLAQRRQTLRRIM